MHTAKGRQQHVRAKVKSLQKEKFYVNTCEEAVPAHKKARLDNQFQSAPFTDPEGQLGTDLSAGTPFIVDSSGWIQLDSPSPNLTAKTPQRHSWPQYTQQQQQQTTFVGRDSDRQAKARKEKASSLKEDLQESFFQSPASLCSTPHDFSTEEVKKELSRLQALSQQLPSSGQAAGGLLASDQSCRQLTWPEASPEDSHPESHSQDFTAPHATPTDLSSTTQQSLEASKCLQPNHHTAPFQLAPGFALAADIKAVERQQSQKPRSKLKRKLAEWGIPPRVAAVSLCDGFWLQLAASLRMTTCREVRMRFQRLSETIRRSTIR